MNLFFEHDGIRFRYQTFGEGRPVVMCHGLGGDLEAPKELVGDPHGFRLIVWDSRAHGETLPLGPIEKLSFAAFADDLAALLDHLQIQKAVIGGISMGAAVSVQFALRHADRLAGLALVRPAWLDRPLPDNLTLFPHIANLLGDLGPEAGLVEFQKRPELAAMRRISPGVADSFCDQFRKPRAVERRARLDRIPRDCPISSSEVLKHFHASALVVGTDRDPLHPLEMARGWAKRLPGAQLAEIPSKYEDPAEHSRQFRRHFGQFLESVIP